MTYQNSKRFKNFLILHCNFAFYILNFKFVQILLAILILFVSPRLTIASELNNKFGIHLAQPHLEALEQAAKLVNSNGGDWGYVTVIIQEDDRKQEKWQEIFDRMRKLHLTPIIRLATRPEGEVWCRPRLRQDYGGQAKKDYVDEWVDFLDSLNWVVKNRYIILFNEPNHGSEWGGEVDAESYAKVAFEFAKKLKERNKDFFIMLAGLDASAPQSPPTYQDEETFLRAISNFQFPISKQASNNQLPISKTIFDYIDGLSSHSYPNPGFSGSPWDSGRGTVKTYEWELNLIKSLGVDKELPVFITETGWKRGSEETAALNYQSAFQAVWSNDPRIMAVTPFVLDYQSEPFLGFSWRKFQNNDFYQQYYTIQSLTKIKGEPEQIEKGKISFQLPKNLVAQSSYQFTVDLKNDGQGFWEKDDGYSLGVKSDQDNKINYLFSDIKDLKPFEEKQISFFIKTNDQIGGQKIRFFLKKNDKKILESHDWWFKILPLPSLNFSVDLFPKLNDKGEDFEVQIFDKNQNMVFRKKNQSAFGGRGVLENIQNIVLGDKYRIVILKPYYLPRQNFIVFKQKDNQISFKPLAPLDFNRDGRLGGQDLISLIKNLQLLRLFIP